MDGVDNGLHSWNACMTISLVKMTCLRKVESGYCNS